MDSNPRRRFLEKRAIERDLARLSTSPFIVTTQIQALTGLAKTILDELQKFRPKSERITGKIKLDLKEEIESYEMSLIRFALARARGNQRRAAQILNIKATTLHAKIKRYGLGSDTDGEDD